MATWTIDSFEACPDTYQGPKPDHIVWLRKQLPTSCRFPAAHTLVQIASNGVSEAEARAIVETMVSALNSAGA